MKNYPIHKGLFCAIYMNKDRGRILYDPDDQSRRNRAIRQFGKEFTEVDPKTFEAALKDHLEETEKYLREMYGVGKDIVPTDF